MTFKFYASILPILNDISIPQDKEKFIDYLPSVRNLMAKRGGQSGAGENL